MKDTTGTGRMKLALGSVLATALLALGLLAGCSSAQESSTSATSSGQATSGQKADPECISVTISVSSPAADNTLSHSDTLTMRADSTVLDALEATGLALDVQDSEYGKFVNSVSGLATEGTKGWTYTVNGEQVQVAADKQQLKADDAIAWSYIDMEDSGGAASAGSDSEETASSETSSEEEAAPEEAATDEAGAAEAAPEEAASGE